jgi:U4/U6 small nuclear ribonucleoprotein PRP3
MEWWDVELLPSKLKKQVAAYEGKALSKQAQSQMQQLGSSSALVVDSEDLRDLQKRCFDQASLSYSKTAALIQHIVPIKPPNAKDGPEAQPTLYLTKRELKRQRKLRRQEKQRELQDMQAAGLVPPPEARLTLKNFIKVLGDQAFLDPSQMEQKVVEQIQARQRAHLERNEANKLTKEQSSAKRAKKLQEDTSAGVHVALFYVKDMSHPYHRTKVDLNAQQYNITGGVLECDVPRMSCVICEGGPKAIKRYQRLMLVRMKWTGPEHVDIEDEDDEGEEGTTHKFNPDNKCELVWTGMAVKRFFKGFVFQSCEVSDQARKILRAKGVGHFWDQVLTHASGRIDHFQLKLADDDDDDSEDQDDQDDNDSEVGYGDMEEDEKEDAMEEDGNDGVAAVAYAKQG